MRRAIEVTNRFLTTVVASGKQMVKVPLLQYEKRQFSKKLPQFEKPYKLHLGCGYHRLDGWMNIDLFETPMTDVLWNIMNPLPIEDNACRFIFHEHVLEHFNVNQGLFLLKECYRLLEPGGVLRVAMPGLNQILENCATGQWKDISGGHMPETRTRAEYINVCFRNWGHQWIYDQEELSLKLNLAGFTTIYPEKWGESQYTELAGIEYRDINSSTLICEAVK